MKNKWLFVTALFTILLCAFSISVSAVKVEYEDTSIDIPNGYSYVTQNTIDDNLTFINEMNFSRADFEKYLKDNKIILFARNDSNEIIVRFDEKFFDEGFDIDLLNADELNKIAKELSAGLDYECVTLGENLFIRTYLSGADNGGNFNVVEYITVQNGNLISVEFYDAENVKFTEKIMATFKTSKGIDSLGKTKEPASDVAVKCLLIGAVVCGIAVAVYLVVTIIIDLKNKRNTSDVAPYVKIKRRKF